MNLLVEAGFSPLEAIQAATLNGAGLLRLTDVGEVAPGFRADLIATPNDPAIDIAALREISLVVLDERVGRAN